LMEDIGIVVEGEHDGYGHGALYPGR
jgi:hypothetical protein